MNLDVTVSFSMIYSNTVDQHWVIAKLFRTALDKALLSTTFKQFPTEKLGIQLTGRCML